MRFERGDLVSPSTAEGYYGDSTTRTSSFTGVSGFEGRPPEIVEQARALSNDIDLIYEYVRNHIDVEFAYGLRKGALGAMIDQSGTPFDINVLFVELARQAGYSARYKIGSATLTAQQFEDWSGLTHAASACRMLAYGGIPATINGVSPADCSIAGSVSGAVIRHVWSEVQISGTWYVFDPSFKPQDFAARRNLESDSGFTSGAAATQAGTGISAGTSSGQAYISNVNTSNLDSYLTARSSALLSTLTSSAFAADMREVVGGPEIVPVYKPAGGFRATSTPYTSANVIEITGDIPDQYRTGLHIEASAPLGSTGGWVSFSRQLWVDEIYGRRLEFDSNFDAEHVQVPADYYNLSFRLELDDVPLNSLARNCGSHSVCLPSFNYQAILDINHPYAASSGTYADQEITGGGGGAIPVAIAHGWGQVSPRLGAKWGTERATDKSLPDRVAGPYNCEAPETLCNPPYASPAGDVSRQRTSANWLAQISAMLALQGEIGQAEVQHHHSVGLVQWQYGWSTFQVGPTGPYDYGISDQQLVIDIRSAVSASHRSGDLNRERAVARSVALAAATLEGSIVEQLQDLPDAASTASRLAWSNNPDEDNCSGGPRKFFDFTGASSGTVSGLMLFEGFAGGCTGSLPINPTTRQSVKDAAAGIISQYVAAGFSVSGSEESFMGPGTRLGFMESTTVCDASCHTTTYFDPSLQRGAAVVASKYDGNGNVLEIAHAVGILGQISKGGGGAQPEFTATTFDPRRAADVLKDRFVDRTAALGVNLANGSVGYTTPVLLSAGSGDGAPYKLDYSLTYQASPECTILFGPCTGPKQGGWTHNWDIHFTLGGSGTEAMGATSPLVATDTILAFMAMQDTFMQTGTANMRRDIYAAMIADWWRQRMVGNVATVTRGFQGQQYIRRADNTWMPPIGAPGVLTQTGARSKVRDTCSPNPSQIAAYPSTARRWDFSNVTFSLRSASGDVMEFDPWSSGYTDNPCAKLYGFNIESWTWPQGPSLSFTGSGTTGISSIASSLGRTMQVGGNTGSTGGRSASINGPETEITDSAGAVWKYAYTAPVARSATQRPRPYAQIYRIFEPVNLTQPALEYTYDALGRVKEAKDAVALQATRDPYQFFIGDGARSRRHDPAGGNYVVYYDQDGNPVRYIDEIGREFSAEYDGRKRVTKRTYPEGDNDVFAYDTSDNLTGLTRNPKPGSGLSPLTISAAYNATWNKISSLTDARGNTTTFTYHPSGNGAGELATAVRPAVGGQSPTYTFGYNAIGLVTSEVDPTGRTTTHGYNSFGDRTSTTAATTAVGGNPALNLASTFTPDSWGDIVTAVDPRGNATTTTYDAARRPTIVKNHDGNSSAVLLAASRTTYDLLGRVTKTEGGKVFSGTNVTEWQMLEEKTYTQTSQVKTVKNGAGNTTSNTYDALDRLIIVTDPVGRKTRNYYDASSQLTRIIRAYNSSLQQDYARYTYTPNGMQASVRDANDNRSVYVYDGFDRLCRLYFPVSTLGANAANTGGIAESSLTCASGGTNPDYEGYGYDNNGNRTSLRVRSGETIGFTFDVLNRQRVKDIPGSSGADVYTEYDLAGRALSSRFVSTSGQGLIYTYDAAGRMLTEQSTIGTSRTLSYRYDAASNRERITWPDANFVTYTYDALNRVDLVREGLSTVLADYDYDNLGRKASLTRGNGTVSTFSYDLASRLDGLTLNLSGTANDQTYTFSYTNASQVSQRSSTNDLYTWAAPAASKSYSSNGLNQYTGISGVGFAYDLRGNVSIFGARNYGYDLENRMTLVGGSASMTLAYDPGGRLRETVSGGSTTQFLHGGNALLAEYNGSGTLLRRYVHGPGIDEPLVWYEGSGLTDKRYLIADRQGSIIAAEGATTTRYTYGPYGEPDSWTGSRFRYTGQIMLPEVQLYHYKARAYDPVLGRFLQTDPVGYADGLNWYSYSSNDPLTGSDPSGLESINCTKFVEELPQCEYDPDTEDESRQKTVTVTVRRQYRLFNGSFAFHDPSVDVYKGSLSDRAVLEAVNASLRAYGVNIAFVPSSRNSMASDVTGAGGQRPVLRTAREAREAARRNGWETTGQRGARNQEIFRDPSTGKYFSRDVDGHRGGAWKGFDSISDAQRGRRIGTYDIDGNRIAD